MAFDFDLFVIGAGSGGTRAARISAAHGARVAVVEKQYLGGTCVNVGCVPKKFLTYAASYAHHFEDAAGYGWDVEPAVHDWGKLLANKDREIDRLNKVYEKLITGPGATLLHGTARVVDPQTVDVDGTIYTAERILIAVGGRPVLPAATEGAEANGITSDDVFYLEEMPKKVIVVGVGYIGIEFAGIFRRLGAEVTLFHRGKLVLNTAFDDDVRQFLQAELVKQGVNLRFECEVEKVEKADKGVVVHSSNCEPMHVDQIMFATGRAPNTDTLGLREIGVWLDGRGAVCVDDEDRTNIPSIYAIGDVTDRVQLTPVATAEGHAFADRYFGGNVRHISYDAIPTAVFSNPPIGTVGFTEAAAKEAFGGDLDVYVSAFSSMRFSLAERDEKTLMKLVVQRSTQRVLGLHMVGQDAPEIVQGFAVAVKMGATKAEFDATIGIHPTAAEEFVTMRQKRQDPPPAMAAS